MKSYILEYKVKPGNFDKAQEIIKELIGSIQNEEGTLLYSPFQYTQERNKFIHVISFENEEAENNHRNSEYTKKFFEEIKQIAIDEPVYTQIEYINSD